MIKKKIIDAKADDKGNITHVKIEGNSTFTPLKNAINMAKNGEIDAVAVTSGKAKAHLRSPADGKEKNNLDHMAGDT